MSRRMFVSYAREDLAAVTELAADLQAVGHEVWLDRNLTGWPGLVEHHPGADPLVRGVRRRDE